MLLRNSLAPPRRASPETTRFALHWGTAARCCHFCRHRLNSRLTTPHRLTPVSSRISRLDLVPISFSSFPFLCEDITLQRSRQDGVAGTVTLQIISDLCNTFVILLSMFQTFFGVLPDLSSACQATVIDSISINFYIAEPVIRLPLFNFLVR